MAAAVGISFGFAISLAIVLGIGYLIFKAIRGLVRKLRTKK